MFAATEINASTSADFLTIAWRKLCLNAAGAINALTLQPARIAHEPNAEMIMRRIVNIFLSLAQETWTPVHDEGNQKKYELAGKPIPKQGLEVAVIGASVL